MVCPSRKNLMVCRIVKDKRDKKENKQEIKEIITEEEHQKRLNKLKELGLIK